MKNLLFLFFLVVSLLACRTLNSTTYIESGQSFVLGKGTHGNYQAQIRNVGKYNIEVLQNNAGVTASLGYLKPNEKQLYPVAKNVTVMFKNASTEKAAIEIKLVGDTGLSMGYEENAGK